MKEGSVLYFSPGSPELNFRRLCAFMYAVNKKCIFHISRGRKNERVKRSGSRKSVPDI